MKTSKRQPKRYSADWFLKFFRSIPAKKWSTGSVQMTNGQCCALGHLGRAMKRMPYNNPAQRKLDTLLGTETYYINDATTGTYGVLGKTPKQRIINALKRVKKGLPLVD